MKKVYAVILIVVCIAIAIVGWNGLMKTYTDNTHLSNNEKPGVDTKEGRNALWKDLSRLDHEYGYHPEDKKNPFVVPVGLLALGVIGICYGAYSLATSIKPKIPGSKPMGG